MLTLPATCLGVVRNVLDSPTSGPPADLWIQIGPDGLSDTCRGISCRMHVYLGTPPTGAGLKPCRRMTQGVARRIDGPAYRHMAREGAHEGSRAPRSGYGVHRANQA